MSSSNGFTDHIDNVIDKSKQISSWILRSFNCRNQNEMLVLWNSLALPIAEFCLVLWSPSKIHDIQRIEQLQWSFLRKIKGTYSLNYWQFLSKFKMYSLQRRRERYMIIYVWKILEHYAPNVNNIISPTQNPRLGRKCNHCTSSNKLKNQQITGIGISLFNIMPKHIRDSSNISIDSFKKSLDKFLCQIPDEPHVQGHTQRQSKSNSLLDIIGTWNLNRGRTLNCSS